MGDMKVVISRDIRVEHPTREIVEWAKENLVLPNPDYAKRLQMNLYMGKTPKNIYLYETHGSTLVFPFGCLYWLEPYFKGSLMWSDFAKAREVDFKGEDMGLYRYQRTAVEEMIRRKYGILESPAGSGKTQMGIALVKAWRRPALWLCHTADLLNQSKERAERYIDPKLIGTITEGQVNIGSGVTFATVQTMCNIDLEKYRDEWDVIIVDECHHLCGSPTQITRYYKVMNSLAARHKYGLSATPDRSDGMVRAMYALVGGVQWKVPEAEVADKILTVTVKPIETGAMIPESAYNPDGTLNHAGLITGLAEDKARNAQIVRKIIEERDHSCLILSDRIDHLKELMLSLPEAMRDKAAMIDGTMTSKTSRAARNHYLEQMRTGEKQYLFATYSLAKEGLDIPRLDRLFLTTPVKYHAIVVQSIGRIARTFPGKTNPIAYDFVDSKIKYCARAWKERVRNYRRVRAEVI